MKNVGKWLLRIIKAFVIVALGNLYSIEQMMNQKWCVLVLVLVFLYLNFIPSVFNMRLKSTRLRLCGNGCELLCLFFDFRRNICNLFYYRICRGTDGWFNHTGTKDLAD